MLIDEKKKVTVMVQEEIVFSILRHIKKKKVPFKVDYLGFYIQEGSGLSTETHGLIGKYTEMGGRVMNRVNFCAAVLIKGIRLFLFHNL